MARKRKAFAHLDYNSPEYWNRLLSAEGLSMAALMGDRRYVNYVGTSNDIVVVEEVELKERERRVSPKDGKKPVREPQRSLAAVIDDMELDKKIAAELKRLDAQKTITAAEAPGERKYFLELSLEPKDLRASGEKSPV